MLLNDRQVVIPFMNILRDGQALIPLVSIGQALIRSLQMLLRDVQPTHSCLIILDMTITSMKVLRDVQVNLFQTTTLRPARIVLVMSRLNRQDTMMEDLKMKQTRPHQHLNRHHHHHRLTLGQICH